MRGQRFPLILCALTLFCFHPLQAEDAAAPSQLSLTDAVGMTIDVNANLKSANQSRLSSLSRLKVASFRTTYSIGSNTELSHYHSTGSSLENSSVNSTDIKKMTQNDIDGLLLSTITFSGFGGTEGTLNISPYSIGNSYGTIGLSLRQPLMRGRGKLSEKANTFRGAEIDASIQDKQFYLTRQSTIQGVIESYYRAVVAREQVKVQERAVSIAEEAVQSARKRADAGLVAEIEVSRAEIRLAQTKDELNQQVQSARGALDRLMLAIGSGVGQTPDLTDSVPEVTMELPTLVDAMKTALANRTELSVYDDRLTDQSRKLAFANDQLRPSFDVVANYNSTNDQKGIISKRLLSLDTLTAGVEFRFPIDKRTTMIEREDAARELDVLQKLRALNMEQIAEQVRSAYRSVDSAKTSLDILGQNLKVAEDNLRMAQRMVDEGLVSNRDVLDAQDSLTRVEAGILSAKVDLFLAYVNLNYSVGSDLVGLVDKMYPAK